MDTRLHLICNGARLDLAPIQGLWTQAQYLRLTDHSRQLLEFTDGRLETLPMPTRRHQAISRCLLLERVCRRGERAESALLEGLAADVTEVFDAA